MKIEYRNLLEHNTLQTREEKNDAYLFLTERHAQIVWYDQKNLLPLTTDEGNPVEVLSPGIWNLGPGPDFKSAHLRMNGVCIKGDVEIHLYDEGWKQHGHDKDPNYDNTILHVSFWKSKQNPLLKTNGGKILPRVYLCSFLADPIDNLLRSIPVDLYPYHEFTGSGYCAQHLFQHLTQEEIQELIASAAIWRLERKCQDMHYYSPNKEERFLRSAAVAFGYKQNAVAFGKLFDVFKAIRSWETDHLMVALMQATGLFESPIPPKWVSSRHFQSLKQRAQKIPDQAHSVELSFQSTRPLNHALRRLALLSHWLHHWPIHLEEQLIQKTLALMSNRPDCTHTILINELCALFPAFPDAYWNTHYLFEDEVAGQHLTLMGKELKTLVLVNAFFPLLYDYFLQRMDEQNLHYFLRLYGKMRGVSSGKARYLTHRFTGNREKGKLFEMQMMQQGAFQIHQDFCIHYESSCLGCPFVARYRAM